MAHVRVNHSSCYCGFSRSDRHFKVSSQPKVDINLAQDLEAWKLDSFCTDAQMHTECMLVAGESINSSQIHTFSLKNVIKISKYTNL